MIPKSAAMHNLTDITIIKVDTFNREALQGLIKMVDDFHNLINGQVGRYCEHHYYFVSLHVMITLIAGIKYFMELILVHHEEYNKI